MDAFAPCPLCGSSPFVTSQDHIDVRCCNPRCPLNTPWFTVSEWRTLTAAEGYRHALQQIADGELEVDCAAQEYAKTILGGQP
jgi:hypothetical protein